MSLLLSEVAMNILYSDIIKVRWNLTHRKGELKIV